MKISYWMLLVSKKKLKYKLKLESIIIYHLLFIVKVFRTIDVAIFFVSLFVAFLSCFAVLKIPILEDRL